MDSKKFKRLADKARKKLLNDVLFSCKNPFTIYVGNISNCDDHVLVYFTIKAELVPCWIFSNIYESFGVFPTVSYSSDKEENFEISILYYAKNK